MTFDQIALFSLFGLVLVLLIWGRLRYDLVAFSALVLAVLVGVIPVGEAFAGFGHPATVMVALIFIISQGLSNSGAVDWLSRLIVNQGRSISAHISVMGGVGAALSAFMNNVAALTLLMPVELQAAAKAKRPPAATLMALAFATMLGGLITLIGTPPTSSSRSSAPPRSASPSACSISRRLGSSSPSPASPSSRSSAGG